MLIEPKMIGSSEGQALLESLLNRFQIGDSGCQSAVEDILTAVRQEGDAAVVKYCRRFDCPDMTASALAVTAAEIAAAYELVDAAFLETLAAAIERIHSFHEREMEDSWMQTREDGTIVGRLVRPVDSAGLYVPGGTGGSTPLVSSVLMNGIPAGIAGVTTRVMVTPPGKDGKISPHLLVAATEIGITEIYKAGSAWGIAALAYGTATIPRVDVIVGPGNQFVTEAKRLVSGMVRIDMIAGPSEVLIVADETADPVYIAADMLAQAEHDPQALSILLTTDRQVAEAVPAEIERQLKTLSRAEIAEKSIVDRAVILVVADIEEAIGLANDIAIEHLELMIVDPWAQVPHIRHAGAIFLGSHTPEAAGDYFAGPNHVLPTMGTARFASALGVETFLKKSSIISYSQTALQNDAEHIQRLANLEGLTAHANSVAVRVK
ncbi:histidinol dehydrogenase [Desulfotalea psychrophila]|uniref:Histidinol dehydrogenase n=1 Tax=Desulfotalea psychrophila (strain LSv54 / DSM 12343) TaxID=177439 RepID=HISX_DESPS|nr:histidinol dehydrogenase [Desulfotalea psychrophila]Q6ANR3.1 RecName: Full=Histidinol dehydrogenase; Short=HDH [Desulfotalea psychrophila LSv54]CAG36011.1 probable histidinol dehydrogenase [Desulfotalea psychrophila LSv54]